MRLAQAEKALVIARDLARDNLARAEAAEKAREASMAAQQDAWAEHAALTARIKGLADKWEQESSWGGDDGAGAEVRALILQPKTATELLDALVDLWGNDYRTAPLVFRLRALLDKPTDE